MKDITLNNYKEKIKYIIENIDYNSILELCNLIKIVWENNRQVFICGNGGSAANAIHFSNDLIYGVTKSGGRGIKAHALPANQSIITCYGNDLSFSDIFSKQLEVLANSGDLLIVLSGSGNSDNIIKAIDKAKEIGMKTCGILGFSGGRAIKLVDLAVHININDMEVSEDIQIIIMHMIKMWLINDKKDSRNKT